MENEDITNHYIAFIEKAWPGSVCLSDLGHPEDAAIIDVFSIPDNMMETFNEFKRVEIRRFMLKNRLPRISILGHSVSDTIKHYPNLNTSLIDNFGMFNWITVHPGTCRADGPQVVGINGSEVYHFSETHDENPRFVVYIKNSGDISIIGSGSGSKSSLPWMIFRA